MSNDITSILIVFVSDLALFYRGFEEPKVGHEGGTRVSDEEPYCGRTALNNADYIYLTSFTYIRKGLKAEEYDSQEYPQVTVMRGECD